MAGKTPAHSRFKPEVLKGDPDSALSFLGLRKADDESDEDTTRITTRISTAQLMRLRNWGLQQKPPIKKDAALIRGLVELHCREENPR